MNPFDVSVSTTGVGGVWSVLVLLTSLVSLGMAVFWVVIGWRAMRAHERLHRAVESLLDEPPRSR